MDWFKGIWTGTPKKDPLVNIQKAIESGHLLVDLPIQNGDFPVRYVSLPEGKKDHGN